MNQDVLKAFQQFMEPVPHLREELSIHSAPRNAFGSPGWTLYDPIANAYYRIGWAEYEMLSRWSPDQSFLDVAQKTSLETTLDVSPELVVKFANFLHHAGLIKRISKPAVPQGTIRPDSLKGRMAKIFKSYFYLRIPLIRPDAFLDRITPHLGFLFSRHLLKIAIVLAFVAMLLVARRWDEYITTFSYFFNFTGAIYGFLALIFIKIVHESGHAITAKYYGCRVPTMGIAFLFLFPVPYTDTSDAWKLSRRKQRLMIDGAGVMSELLLAVLATYLWIILPDGPLRSVSFLLSSTTWIVSLGLNLNPFLKFDGYYLLSDALDVPNMQEQCFALGRWRLRRWLLGVEDKPPVTFPRGKHNGLITLAYATWAYRFFMFLGIALLVYVFFFKLLGILLFAMNIIWLIIRPVIKELRYYYSRRNE